ncbi:compound eye opsin BCRH2-like [Stegostoma tigrinum]|uniref:compound eye opsin BCRH2-like n=1 Tax=Stegostoma tigrinum TaxID=3053191 RepID=UPI002870AF4B|nr:compound eye opsin BCRH2-like [Stegostoma tigrinum]
MAVSDILVLVTSVILNRIAGIYFPYSFLSITPVCSLRTVLTSTAVDSSTWLTVTFTFDRFVVISCQKLKIKYCTKKTATCVTGIVSALCTIKSAFSYFIYEPLYTFNNVPWFCKPKLIFYLSPAWIAYDLIRCIFNPLLPFVLILLLNALTVRYILVANRARRRLRAQSHGENQNDQEIEKRRKSIVLLFAISGSFLLLYFLFFITILYVQIAKVSYFSGSDFSESTFILEENGFMFLFLCSCINPFIYAGSQNKFRVELKNGLKYPLRRFLK